MGAFHHVVFGDCRTMREIPDGSVHLMVTSPPYYNAPFDYPGLFRDYDEFLGLMREFSKELYRVLAPGRIACFVTDDMLVEGEKFPVVADTTRIMLDAGFRYRDRIVWVKPKGYIRISRRSGVVLQHPYPMYYYPDNIQESILVFQKGKFDYSYAKTLPDDVLEESKINTDEYNAQEWYLTVWNITNVLPFGRRPEKGVAAFPEEIPRRLIRLYSYAGETVLDPFLGSGTTAKVAKELSRGSWGYEVDLELKDVIARRIGEPVTFSTREDARKLRKSLQSQVKRQKSVAKRTRSLPKLAH